MKKTDLPLFPCVMLAAGKSERMGRWKISMEWEELTIIETSVNRALSSCHSVVIVSGYKSKELHDLFSAPRWQTFKNRIEIVHAGSWEEGMFASAMRGFKEIPDHAGWCFLALGDMPLVSPDIYRQLGEHANTQGTWKTVIPQYKGKKGHPVLLEKEALRYALTLQDSRSMRDVISAFPSLIVPASESGILQDIDTPEDYEDCK